MELKHFISINDLKKEDIDFFLKKAGSMLELLESKKSVNICRGKILATLFFEASTRTRLSFECAMHRLGGSVIGFADAGSSSVSKGESIADTIRTVESYSDIIVMRNPFEGAAKVAANNCSVPIINAGDGGHEHPTQTLLDLFTINKKKKSLSNLTIGLCGDLKFGRTVHSLAKALSEFKGNTMICIAPHELQFPEGIRKKIEDTGTKIIQTDNLKKAIARLDVLYVTRIQKERFVSEKEYLRLKGIYVVDRKMLEKANKDLIVMHPLPRVDEINPEVDRDSRCVYFQQAFYGVPMRMALLSVMLKCEK
ncbi:MAG: aspartate carbamoyltransferase [Candidatus Nanohalarchaeota archaeon]|nr:MAG: aspartate carbamoyltransferase [Candidatus Nanohaloarchaeota archaeon]